jgi:hypothetical protein
MLLLSALLMSDLSFVLTWLRYGGAGRRGGRGGRGGRDVGEKTRENVVYVFHLLFER